MPIDLKAHYNNLYKEGKDATWGDHQRTKEGLTESQQSVLELMKAKNFTPKSMLDFGCGKGEFLNYFKNVQTRNGIDFSQIAIEHAKKSDKNINLILGCEDQISGTYDLVTAFGVLEHVDHPQKVFQKLYDVTNKGGYLYIVCPNHTNIRGVVWQTLSLLFDVPMSLADRHIISYSDVKSWVNDKNSESEIEFTSINTDIGMGSAMIDDLHKRLTNALRDAKMDNSKVGRLLKWLDKNKEYFSSNQYSGWHAVFGISKN